MHANTQHSWKFRFHDQLQNIRLIGIKSNQIEIKRRIEKLQRTYCS